VSDPRPGPRARGPRHRRRATSSRCARCSRPAVACCSSSRSRSRRRSTRRSATVIAISTISDGWRVGALGARVGGSDSWSSPSRFVMRCRAAASRGGFSSRPSSAHPLLIVLVTVITYAVRSRTRCRPGWHSASGSSACSGRCDACRADSFSSRACWRYARVSDAAGAGRCVVRAGGRRPGRFVDGAWPARSRRRRTSSSRTPSRSCW